MHTYIPTSSNSSNNKNNNNNNNNNTINDINSNNYNPNFIKIQIKQNNTSVISCNKYRNINIENKNNVKLLNIIFYKGMIINTIYGEGIIIQFIDCSKNMNYMNKTSMNIINNNNNNNNNNKELNNELFTIKVQLGFGILYILSTEVNNTIIHNNYNNNNNNSNNNNNNINNKGDLKNEDTTTNTVSTFINQNINNIKELFTNKDTYIDIINNDDNDGLLYK
jgi:hypothetical protein